MESPIVKCEVETCIHNIPGQMCGAANIDILDKNEQTDSKNAGETKCKTFYRKRGLANYLGGFDNVNWGGIVSEVITPGKELTPSVTCIVNTCKYWDRGNQCHAEEIKVTGRDAEECEVTDCATFENKD
jgi:hypothetical protein